MTENKTAPAVRKSSTKSTPTWARKVSGIVRRWPDRDRFETLSTLTLNCRLAYLFAAGCGRSARPWEEFAAETRAWTTIRKILGSFELATDGEKPTEVQITTLRRFGWDTVRDLGISSRSTERFALRCADSWTHLMSLNANAPATPFSPVCTAIDQCVDLIARRIKKPRVVRRSPSALEFSDFAGSAGEVARAHQRAIEGTVTVARTIQGRLLAGIVGPDWRLDQEWRTSTTVALARAMYEWRDFSAMPILADALQDCGCDNEDWLARMRDPNWPWCRGCHIVDSLIPDIVGDQV